jgi:hypothetical protein
MMLRSVYGPQKQYWRLGGKQFSDFDQTLRADQYREVFTSMLIVFGSNASSPFIINSKTYLSRRICKTMVRHLSLPPPTLVFSTRPDKPHHQICTTKTPAASRSNINIIKFPTSQIPLGLLFAPLACATDSKISNLNGTKAGVCIVGLKLNSVGAGSSNALVIGSK